ncbi:TPA: hypothetical protein ACHGBL_000839 [Escherichia coli]
MFLTVPRALSRIHRITKFTLKKGGRAVAKQKLIPPKFPVPTNKHGDVVTGLSLRRMVNLTTRRPNQEKEITPAILTAAPFRGLPQPEAHGRIKFNDSSKGEGLRRALSCCVPAFNHVRRGGFRHFPTTENLYNPDIPNNEKSV